MAESNADIARRLRELLLTCGLDGYVLLRADYAEKIASRLEALQEGVVVPREPTAEMVLAASSLHRKWENADGDFSDGYWQNIYRSMLSARPLGGGK